MAAPRAPPPARAGGGAVEKEFMCLNALYEDIAKRQRRAPSYLHRNLQYLSLVGKASRGDPPASVIFFCGHRNVTWSKSFRDVRCAWCCQRGCVKFTNATQLAEHLRTCHSRFRYAVDSSTVAADGKIHVEVQLLLGSAGQSAARVDRLKAWDTEAVYVNPRKYPKYSADLHDNSTRGVWKTTLFVTRKPSGSEPQFSAGSGGKTRQRSPSTNGGSNGDRCAELYAMNRRRLAKSVDKAPFLTFDALNVYVTRYKPGGIDEPQAAGANAGSSGQDLSTADNSFDGLAGSASASGSDPKDERPDDAVSLGKAYATGKRKAKRRNSQRRNEWADVVDKFTEGVQDGWLFRSVIQSTPSVEEFEAGYDSDAENVVDEDWRLEVGDKLLSEFVDTSAQEKMYMSLWNQYVLREVYVYSDKRQLDVCCLFAHRYGGVLYALNLNIIFVRHLQELHSRGLIDAAGVHQAIVELGRARIDAIADSESVDEQLAQFAFHARIMSEDAKLATK